MGARIGMTELEGAKLKPKRAGHLCQEKAVALHSWEVMRVI